MKKIKITEENYELYKELYNFKTNPDDIYTPLQKKLCFLLWMIIPGLGFGLYSAIVFASFTLPIIIPIILVMLPPIIFSSSKLLDAITYKLDDFITRLVGKNNFKKFKEKNPNLNTYIDVNELEKKLEEYKSTKTEKTIENTKEEHLSNFNENFRKMTTQERLELLNKEKEFWEQVYIQEQYQELQIEEKGIQKEYHN